MLRISKDSTSKYKIQPIYIQGFLYPRKREYVNSHYNYTTCNYQPLTIKKFLKE